MELGRIEDGLTAEQKLQRMQLMTPAERRRLKEERKKKREEFLEQAYAAWADDDDSSGPYSKSRFSKEDIEAARLHGVSRALLYYRVERKGWSIEKAIKTPVSKKSWTDEDDELIRQELLKGKTGLQITLNFPDRTKSAVEIRCTMIRKQLRQEKHRNSSHTEFKYWSASEEQQVLAMRRQGISTPVIAKKVGRTPNAVYKKVRQLEGRV